MRPVKGSEEVKEEAEEEACSQEGKMRRQNRLRRAFSGVRNCFACSHFKDIDSKCSVRPLHHSCIE